MSALHLLIKLLVADSTRNKVWSGETHVGCPREGHSRRCTRKAIEVAWLHRLIGVSFLQISKIVTDVEEPCIFFTKLALLLFYHRIFYPDKKTRYAIWLGVVVSFLAYLIIMILFISISDLHTKLVLSRAIGVVNVVTDFYTLTIPIVAVSRLQMSRSRKIGVSAVFLTGAL